MADPDPLAELTHDEREALVELAKARTEGIASRRDLMQGAGYVGLGALLGGGGATALTGSAAAAATGEAGTSADPLLKLYAAEILGGSSAPVDFGDAVTFDHEAISSATTVGNVTYVYYDSSVAGFTGTIPASLENRGGFIVWIDEGASVASNNVDVTSANWTVDGVASSTIDANQSVYILFANPNQSDWTSRIFTETVDARSVVTDQVTFAAPTVAAQYTGRNLEFQYPNHDSVADSGKVQLWNDASVDGFGWVLRDGGSTIGQFVFQGGSSATKVNDPTDNFTTTEDNDGTVNVYWDAGNSRFELNNELGGSVSFEVIGWVSPA